MVRGEDGILLVPESYAVPMDLVGNEYQHPGSQPREVVGRCPFLWGQSLFILGRLLQEVNIILNILAIYSKISLVSYKKSSLFKEAQFIIRKAIFKASIVNAKMDILHG